jgi:D-amino peptidase
MALIKCHRRAYPGRHAVSGRALLIPGMDREDGRTLRYEAPDFPTAHQVTQLIAVLGGS